MSSGAAVEEDALAGRRYIKVVAVRVDEAPKGYALDALDGAQLRPTDDGGGRGRMREAVAR